MQHCTTSVSVLPARHASHALANVMSTFLLLAALCALAPRESSAGAAEFVVNNAITSGVEADLAVTADGAFVVAWQSMPDAAGSFEQIAARRYAANGAPLAGEFRVDGSASAALAPTLALAADGQFAVAWWHFDGFEIHGRRYAASGAAIGSEFIASKPPFAGLTQIGNPAIARIFLDQFVVVWEGTGDFVRYDIAGRRIDSAGLPIGTGFIVNTSFVADHSLAAVSADAAGNYVVAWNAGSTILARRFTSAGAFGPPFEIATGAGLGVALAADGAGNVIAAWPQAGTIMARRFGPNTLPLGAAFRVDVSAAASFPDVAAWADGRFVVAWQKAINGIADTDVLARRFDASGQPSGGELPINLTTAGNRTRQWIRGHLDIPGAAGQCDGHRRASHRHARPPVRARLRVVARRANWRLRIAQHRHLVQIRCATCGTPEGPSRQ